MSKIAQNRYQKCPNVFWTCFGAVIFEKFSLPSVPWRVESSKVFKKIKNFSQVQNCPKSFAKLSKRVLFWTCFGANFSKKFFCPLFHGGSSLRKFSKFPKIVPKSVQTCFEQTLGHFFRIIFCPLFNRGSSLQLRLIWTPNNGNSICRKVDRKLKMRRAALHAIILHCGTKSAMIATPTALTLTDLYTRFFQSATLSQFNDSDNQIQTIFYYITEK